jgi:hypothetical protein
MESKMLRFMSYVGAGVMFLALPAAAEIKSVRVSVDVAPSSKAETQITCPDGFTPIGFNLVSARVLGHFKEVPEGRRAKLEFFNWAGPGGARETATVELICTD